MVFISCDGYLSKTPSPSSGVPINNVSQLIAIYDNINIEERNCFAAYSNDDGYLTQELYKASPSTFSMNYTVFYNIFYTDGISSAASDAFWNREYSNIFTANTIINNVDKVEGNFPEKIMVKCNAHFLRAYSYFTLAQYYCLPYCEANKNALGLPKRLNTNFEEEINRIPLDDVYKLIFSDIESADEILDEAVDSKFPWRISKATINALLARIYMVMGNYKDALINAEKALAGAPELLDFNQLDYAPVTPYPEDGDMPQQDIYNCETSLWNKVKYLHWQEFIYPRIIYMPTQWYIPSDDLVNLYDHDNDRRFLLFFVEHGNRRMYVPHEAYRYNQFDDGRYIISGLTTAEMLLIKAEAEIRLNKWQDGLKTLDILRNKRYNTGTYVPLTASNQNEALKIVLEERRREMPFSSRVSDIKRYSVNELPDDDVTVVKDFFEISTSEVFTDKPKTYTIPANSSLWAMPINDIEISASNNAIQQNDYK